MLKAKKKLAKKEIKEDTLLKTYAQATSFYYENKKYVNYAITGVVIVVIAMFVIVNNRRANNEKATVELGRVFQIFDAGANDVAQYQVAINGQPERGIMGLKAIVSNYGNTDAGDMARFYLGTAYYNLGNYDEALPQFEKFSSGTPLLRAAALAGAGGCYEAKREYAKAGAAFDKAASLIPTESRAPEYLTSAGRNYGLAGEKEKSVSIFQRIKKEFPTSSAARDADRYISQFSA